MCRLNPGEQADRLCQVYDDILSKGLLAPNGSFVPGAEDAAGTEVVQLREMLLQLYRSATPEADTWLHMLQHSEDPETSVNARTTAPVSGVVEAQEGHSNQQ